VTAAGTAPPHPLAAVVSDAAGGRFPTVDGGWERLTPWRSGLAAVVAFTGHAYLVVDEGVELPADVNALVDGVGGAHHPRVATAIAGPGGWIDSLDAVLVTRGGGADGALALVDRPDLADHPRVGFARRVRDDVRCLGRPGGTSLVTVGRGLGGLIEVGIELGDDGASGRDLLRAAIAAMPTTELVVAAVAPGNARALRSFLAAGFVPIASVQLILPD
jgi:hypothetical protein